MPNARLKVFLVVHSLIGGGAERVVVRLARFLDRSKFEPVLVLFQKQGPYLSEVPDDVRILDCERYGAGGRVRWLGRLVGFLRCERPDVIVSFLWFTNVVVLLARWAALGRSRLVVSERVTLEGAREGVVTEALRKVALFLLYRWADRVVPNSEAMGRQLVKRLLLPARKMTPLPNPVDVETILARANEGAALPTRDLPLVVGMGRLTPQKGFDLLLRAASLAQVTFRVALLGTGPGLAELRRLADELGVAGRIEFPGFVENPYPLLSSASAFVLASRYEGFPNALVEAMALGVPCVATRCPTGPEEILTDGTDGLLVPMEDPAALAAALDRLLGDPGLSERIGRAGAARAGDFDAPKILRRFEALIQEVAA